MSRLIPNTVYTFNHKLKQWTSASKEETIGFRRAKKVLLPGLSMWEPIYEVYNSQNKFKYYVGEASSWYIADVGNEANTLREIKEIEKGVDKNYIKTLVESLRKQEN